MEQTNVGGNPNPVEPVIADNSTTQEPVKVETPVEVAPQVEVKPAEVKPQTPEVKKTPSLLDVEDTSTPITDDLRQKLARGDEKTSKFLSKFKTVDDVVKSYRELESKFHKTKGAPELAKDATPEQLKEYREQVGIPESWEKYDTELEGVNIGEADKPMVDDFLKRAHEKNLRPTEVKNALQAYFEVATEKNREQFQKVEQETKQAVEQLKKEWGNNFESNAAMIRNHLQTQFQDGFSKIAGATLPDGRNLFDDPAIANFFLNSAKGSGQSHTMLPNSSDPISLSDRKSEIEKVFKDNPNAFYNNPKLSEELNQIESALKKMQNS